MSSIPQPRFVEGDVVFYAMANAVTIQADCPDCKGSKVWACTSPAGESFDVPCPRCQSSHSWTLRHRKFTTAIAQRTIGSVRINTDDIKRPISYMCHETGVGSGSVYYEDQLSATEAEAEMKGKIAVAEREAALVDEIARAERNSGGRATHPSPDIQGFLETRLRYHTFETAAISRESSRRFRAEYDRENLQNAIAELDEYGGIEGLDTPTLNRICAHLADVSPGVAVSRETVLYDRAKAEKAL